MTRNQEEIERIKSERSMRSIVEMYGFQVNRGGFISCPFHVKDHTASLKIYPKSYYCFGCGAHGDIFNFVQSIEGIKFKDAFEKLGGHNHTLTRKESSWLRHMTAIRQKKAKEIVRLNQQYSSICLDIQLYRQWCQINEPPNNCSSFDEWGNGAEEWIWAFEHLQYAEYRADLILNHIKKIKEGVYV